MKTFTFRLSRVIAILTLLILLMCNIFIFFQVWTGGGEWYGILPYIILTVVVLIPIFIFNWLCFGKFSFWMKNPNKENTIDR